MLTDALRLAPGQGQSMLKTARLLATTFPATAQALEEGLISYPHAAAITRANAKLPADRLADAEPLLLQVAAAGSAAMVRAAVDHMAELLEPEHHDQQDQDTRARRYLNVSATLDGWWAVDGHLPPEIGQRLSAALEDFAAPADPTDPRTAPQRRADAIAEIADAAVDGQTTGITAVTITADADHLDGVGADLGRQRHARRPEHLRPGRVSMPAHPRGLRTRRDRLEPTGRGQTQPLRHPRPTRRPAPPRRPLHLPRLHPPRPPLPRPPHHRLARRRARPTCQTWSCSAPTTTGWSTSAAPPSPTTPTQPGGYIATPSRRHTTTAA